MKKPSERGKRSKRSRTLGTDVVTDPPKAVFGENQAKVAEPGVHVHINRLRSAWRTGDWEMLANLNVGSHDKEPERHLIALLAASAQQQLGYHEEARSNVRLAIGWGCHPRLVAQILVAGVHNTLGRAAALTRDTVRSQQHFHAAVLPSANDSDTGLLGQVRSMREMTRLDLLPEAAQLLGSAIKQTSQSADRPDQTNARIKVLESELDLLIHELSLAQQRRTAFERIHETDVPSNSLGSPQSVLKLRERAMSQLGQDLWVLEMTAYKKGGYFVEFGATDGVLLSNTYLLETEFGWTGLCSEPNPKMFAQLQHNRKCGVSDACIAGVSGQEVDFIFAGAFGGIAEHCSADEHGVRRAAYAAAGHRGRLTTVSLHDLLQRHRAPRDIDYLSIDTEGSELEILANFPFERWNIRLITVEHNHTLHRQSIFQLLQRHGYQRKEREWDDWYSRIDTQD